MSIRRRISRGRWCSRSVLISARKRVSTAWHCTACICILVHAGERVLGRSTRVLTAEASRRGFGSGLCRRWAIVLRVPRKRVLIGSPWSWLCADRRLATMYGSHVGHS